MGENGVWGATNKNPKIKDTLQSNDERSTKGACLGLDINISREMLRSMGGSLGASQSARAFFERRCNAIHSVSESEYILS